VNLKKKICYLHPVEIIFFTNVLGDVCRSRREGQTEEDVRLDIFDLHCPRHCGTAKIPSGSSRVRHLSPMANIPPCDISGKPFQHGMLIPKSEQGFLQSHYLVFNRILVLSENRKTKYFSK
jgi:hypothetical protein